MKLATLEEMVAAGVPAGEARAGIEERTRIHEALDNSMCPTCGSPLARRVDARQSGVRPEGTTWVNYRCGACGYGCDRPETLAPHPRAAQREEFLAKLIASGVPRDQAYAFLAWNRKVDAALDAGRCPECDGRLSRQIDVRQSGPKPEGSTWVNYRCLSCPYFCDRAEDLVGPADCV